MILTIIALSALISGPQDTKPVTLNRVFSKGEKLQYAIKSNLHLEAREYPLTTFLPSDVDINYKFTTEVKDLKNDGVALIHYLRPTEIWTNGETFDHPSKTRIDKVDLNLDLTVSPINNLLEEKDLNPPKKKPPTKGDPDDGGGLYLRRAFGKSQDNPLQAIFASFVGEVQRLALNLGPLDSSLDFAPKLPLDEVKVGDTWKETIGYEPQALKGANAKQAVQRLDYTFTYKGVVTVNGKQFYRVNATLDFTNDLGSFINQLAHAKPEDTGLKSAPLTLKQSIDFDLDMATRRTILAQSKADGTVKVNITQLPDDPVAEERITGSTEMRLVAIGAATPVKHAGKGRK